MTRNTIFIFLITVLSVILLDSCKPGYFKPAQFERMKWIDGTWSSTDQGITISESWKYNGETGFHGLSYIATGRDTLYFERLLIQSGPKRTMVMKSETGQVQIESSEPMVLIRLSRGSFTFKDPTSGRTVTYKNNKDLSVQIIIRETVEGNESKTKYELKKMNQ